MNAPRVSVILPTFNRAHLLPRAVDSALAQTTPDLELIIVDDGSTDDTEAVAAAIDDPRVVYHRLPSNGGAAAARNAGVAIARAPLLAFLDSDDAWHPDKLERQAEAMNRATDPVSLCACSMAVERGRERFTIQWRDEELGSGEALDRILAGMGLGTVGWLVRRDAFVAAGGFDETLPRLQDYELTLRIAARGRVRLMSDVLATVALQDDSVSASAGRYADAVTAILARHQALFADHPRGHSHLLFRAGKYFAIEGNRPAARRWFRRALGVRPGNLRAQAGWLLCALGLMSAFTRMKYGR